MFRVSLALKPNILYLSLRTHVFKALGHKDHRGENLLKP